MIKSISLLIAGTAALAVSAAAVSAQSLTRIEPRPYYGATISIEEGVRVFRPLPATKNIIINPGNRTPLTLKIDGDGNVTRPATVNNVNVDTRVIRHAPRTTFRVNPTIR